MGYSWKKETREMYVYIGRLRKSGLTGEALQKAIVAIKGATNAVNVKIPKAVAKNIGAVLGGGDKAVVVRNKVGLIRVYSLASYLRLVEASRKAVTEKWAKRKASKPASKRRAKKKRKPYVHWTHKPENAEKLAKVKLNLKKKQHKG